MTTTVGETTTTCRPLLGTPLTNAQTFTTVTNALRPFSLSFYCDNYYTKSRGILELGLQIFWVAPCLRSAESVRV